MTDCLVTQGCRTSLLAGIRRRHSRALRSFGEECRRERWIEQLGPGCVLLGQFIVQNRIEQQLVDSNASVVIDVAELSETIHEKADAGAGCADHLGKIVMRYRLDEIGRASRRERW